MVLWICSVSKDSEWLLPHEEIYEFLHSILASFVRPVLLAFPMHHREMGRWHLSSPDIPLACGKKPLFALLLPQCQGKSPVPVHCCPLVVGSSWVMLSIQCGTAGNYCLSPYVTSHSQVKHGRRKCKEVHACFFLFLLCAPMKGGKERSISWDPLPGQT